VVHGGVWWRLTTLFSAAIFIFMIMFINQISMVVYGGVRWCTVVYGGVRNNDVACTYNRCAHRRLYTTVHHQISMSLAHTCYVRLRLHGVQELLLFVLAAMPPSIPLMHQQLSKTTTLSGPETLGNVIAS
jgi:hypothetical protein